MVAVSFIGGGNRRKPPTCRKSLTNFITYCCIEYTPPEWDSNSQLLVVIGTEYIDSCKLPYDHHHDGPYSKKKKSQLIIFDKRTPLKQKNSPRWYI